MALAVLTRLRRSAVTLPLAVLAAVAAIGFNESAYKSSMESLDGQVQRDPARMHIRNVQGRLIDAETGQRGFLLTERADYLDPYRRAANDVNSSLDWLEKYYRDDATPLKLVGDIRARAVAKLSELETTIRLQQEGRHEAWRELTLTDIGREQMVEIRDLSAALLDVELQRVARDRDHIYRTLSNGRIGQNGLILVILLALVFFL
ncbi:MAG: CHASE3 domain-containing protein, partial [Burkholderiaceae bacterium]